MVGRARINFPLVAPAGIKLPVGHCSHFSKAEIPSVRPISQLCVLREMLKFLVRRTAPPELDPDGPSRVERLAAEEWLAARIGIPWPPEPQAVHAGRPTFAAEYQAALQQFVRTHALEEELLRRPQETPRRPQEGSRMVMWMVMAEW